MEGGGQAFVQLADIGDFRKMEEIVTVTEASVFTTFLVVLAARVGNVGGFALNDMFQQFGLESVVGVVSLETLLLQLVRYFYWVVYGSYGKPWSPFIFVCIAVGLQMLFDAALKYGLFAILPKGKNELLDSLRAYYFEADMMVFVGHSILIATTALVAMILHEVADLPRYVIMATVALGIVLAISGVPAKPKPVAPPPKKKEEMKDMRNYY